MEHLWSSLSYLNYRRTDDTMASIDHKDPIDDAQNVEKYQRPSGIAANMSPERRKEVEKKLKRKLDARCSLFVLIYIMNYLDRNNIAAARLGGLQEDLGINNTQYATCLSILYVGYILVSIASIYGNRRLGKVLTCGADASPIQHDHQQDSTSLDLHLNRHASLGHDLYAFRQRNQLQRYGSDSFLHWICRGCFPAWCASHPVEVVHEERIDAAQRHPFLRKLDLECVLESSRRSGARKYGRHARPQGVEVAVLD